MLDRIRLVVFDWAGTTVDHGCFGPVAPFVTTYARHGIFLTMAEARGPMGLHKKDHIRALARMPRVAEHWRQNHGRDCVEEDIELLYSQHFVPLQLEEIRKHSRLVPGLLGCVAELRARGIAIATTTGYFRGAAKMLYAAAAEQGFVPDHTVCAEDVPAGRPAPWMIFRNMEALGVYPTRGVVKVGDTPPDMEEGRNAGAWTIGVTQTSSLVGCAEDEFNSLASAEQSAKCAVAEEVLRQSGAHAVIGSVADLPVLLREIESWLR